MSDLDSKITSTNHADNLRDISHGNFDSKNYKHSPIPNSTFVRMIVMDVISDPVRDSQDKEFQTKLAGIGVSNMRYAPLLPRNTIVAKKVNEPGRPMFIFPFFPSHLSLPCKPGECVWVMFEKPDAQYSDIGYWFCRVVDFSTVDDVNHAHTGRSYEPTVAAGTKQVLDSSKEGKTPGDKVIYELRNGPVVKVDKERKTSPQNTILQGEKEDVFEKIVFNSRAALLTSYEAVPRFKKRPGDIAFEGSNNTLIVLGTERKDVLKDSAVENLNKEIGKGSIDIVVGRGQSKEKFGKVASTTSITNVPDGGRGKEIKKELNKTFDTIVPDEGDPDLKNDRSRILLSQKTKVDENFGLKSYNTPLSVTDSQNGDAAIVIKSDKIRLMARSDIEIVVTDFSEKKGPNDETYKEQNEGNTSWASIVINKKGEIIIKPSQTGVIKLGGEEADKAVLCSTAIVAAGQVTAAPLTDTMGGSLGIPGTSSTGVYATKVLLK
jgi:hypothetical protein